MIRVLILADSLLRAQNLAGILSEDERLDIADARAAFSSHEPGPVDVIVTAGLPPARILRWGLPVVALTDDVLAEENADAVHACLPPNSPVALIAAAITAASHDLIVLTRQQGKERLAHSSPAMGEYTGAETLTPREFEVLRLLAAGLGNKQLAGQLGISNHTAKFHVAQILAKLGAGSRTEAVSIAIRRGLIPI